MASRAQSGPQPIQAAGSSQTLTTASEAFSAELMSQKFDEAIALRIHLWRALDMAVMDCLGGPDSSDKRDWLAGFISETFTSRPDTNEDDVEEILLDFMGTEFEECYIDDGSEIEVASDICRLRRLIGRGQFGEVETLREKWEAKQKKGPERVMRPVMDDGEEMGDSDDGEEEDEEEDGGVDVEMEDAPALVPVKEKPALEVDEEGFTRVVGKKRR